MAENIHDHEFLIIGPTGAGKTSLLAILDHGIKSRPDSEKDKLEVSLYSTSSSMDALIKRAQSTIETDGRLPLEGTRELTEFTFDLVLRRRRFFKTTEEVAKFRMWDGPGDAIFPDSNGEVDFAVFADFRAKLVDALKRCGGFLLCLDSKHERKATNALFINLPEIFSRTGERNLPNCERVAICLTKADAHFAGHGQAARARLEQTSATQHAATIVPRASNATIRQYVRPETQIGYGWTSVYGFLENDGAPNYDPKADKLLYVNDNGTHTVNYWQPYRVLEPFQFLANGTRGALEIQPARRLR